MPFKLIAGRYLITKHPESKLDYGVRMARWLPPGDSLSLLVTPVWVTSVGLVVLGQGVINDPKYGPVAMVKLGGGVPSGEEWASCHWTTVLGREEVQTLWFNMTTIQPASP